MWLSVIVVIAQGVPPTPTMIPLGAPLLTFPDTGMAAWDIAPTTVGIWNQFGDAASGLQAIILLMAVVVGIFFVRKLIMTLGTNERGDE